jgi:biotin-dependent carboxylase-like uncharacterized protein
LNQLEVIDPGLLTTVQDAGRAGYAHTGVPPSGAVDLLAFELGNRLVGNSPTAAALETTLLGPRLRLREAARVALTGAPTPHGANVVLEVSAGETFDVGSALVGARTYVCISGGIEVEPELGSRSTDLLTGIGPRPLRAGDVLPLGTPSESVHGHEGLAAPPPSLPAQVVLRVVFGPRDDWFTDGACQSLCTAAWQVTPSGNRVGVRLDGPALERRRHDELQSEGLATGSLQVPSSGLPILLLNDHPTTGGYPVIAVVRSEDLPLAGQLRPGQTVRFAESG